MSWGGAEFSGESSYDSYFTAHGGVTFVASSGDPGGIVEYPAASANVLAVGGTTLTLNSSGNYGSESGWSDSGGGISQYISQPAYQNGVVTQSTTMRTVPDVAFDADPASGVAVYDSWDFQHLAVDPGWRDEPVGPPVGRRHRDGQPGPGLGEPADAGWGLPDPPHASMRLPASDFHDITTGNNGYAAGPGYDLVTGRGTPIVNLLAPALVGTPFNDPPTSSGIETSALAYTENDPATAITATMTAADVDSTNLASATVQITGNYQNGQDVLAFTDTPNITGIWNAATGHADLERQRHRGQLPGGPAGRHVPEHQRQPQRPDPDGDLHGQRRRRPTATR